MGILKKLIKGKDEAEEPKKAKAEPKKKESKKEDKKEVKAKSVTIKEGRDTKNAYSVLVRPLVTEKSTQLSNKSQYVFEVAKDANKITVAQAIEALYGVKPLSVNVINVRGKRVNFGRFSGKRKNFKKAIVTVSSKTKLAVFEGV